MCFLCGHGVQIFEMTPNLHIANDGNREELPNQRVLITTCVLVLNMYIIWFSFRNFNNDSFNYFILYVDQPVPLQRSAGLGGPHESTCRVRNG
jgi:hypothetical protein